MESCRGKRRRCDPRRYRIVQQAAAAAAAAAVASMKSSSGCMDDAGPTARTLIVRPTRRPTRSCSLFPLNYTRRTAPHSTALPGARRQKAVLPLYSVPARCFLCRLELRTTPSNQSHSHQSIQHSLHPAVGIDTAYDPSSNNDHINININHGDCTCINV